ncbi:MAG TPA: hypothetical protein ENK14_04335 [Caldithrix sp.]|nr:hypothetical protein [Caldithrix sp.]
MYYLGVDGGGTKTTAVLSDLSGETVRTIKAGVGNIALLDRGSTAHLIRSILRSLLAGEKTDRILRATFGFAGAGRHEEKEMVSALIRAAGIQNFTVMTDAEILHYAIFGEQQGMLISAGTGSICVIRNEQSKFQQIGGWGYLLGDEGSGFYIGNRAIKQALLEIVAGEKPSRLTNELLLFYGLEKPENLITITYSSINPPKLVASCARLVCDLAEQGEPNAQKIVEDAATALLNLASLAVKQYQGEKPAIYKVALAGSILKESSIVNHLFKKRAAEKGLHFEYTRQELPPSAAGVLYSIKTDGKSAPASLIEKLKGIQFAE